MSKKKRHPSYQLETDNRFGRYYYRCFTFTLFNWIDTDT